MQTVHKKEYRKQTQQNEASPYSGRNKSNPNKNYLSSKVS